MKTVEVKFEPTVELYVYKLKGGAIVHTVCREPYVKKHTSAYNYPGIEAALYHGYPMSRFQLCAQCEAPIWSAPKATPQTVKEAL